MPQRGAPPRQSPLTAPTGQRGQAPQATPPPAPQPPPGMGGYSRAELLDAFRKDDPRLQAVGDNELFAAIAQDHPDAVRGISELQEPVAREQGTVTGALLEAANPLPAASAIYGDYSSRLQKSTE